MADIIYKVTQDDPNSIQGFEQFSEADKDLIGTFEVNNLFNPSKHTSEVHIYSLVDDLIESHYGYTNYKQLGNAQSAGKSGASVLSIDPIADSKVYGYDNGGIKLLYHFINDLYSKDKSSTEFYIDSISEDRTEVRLGCLSLSSEDITQYTTTVKEALQSTSYFNEFRLNFKSNDLFIGINIDTVDYNGGKAVVVKLYEPLPVTYTEKSTLNIVEIVSDSVAFEVDSDIILEQNVQPSLKPANFNLEVADEHVVPSQYYTYDELFSYPINNSNSQIYSMINEKGAEISIDYSDFNNFVHFSSAYERLINFKYKLDLIISYSSSIATTGSATTGLQGVSGSRIYYENLITGIVSNFDHYERFLYYESGSNSWPKSNNTKPYINKNSTSTEAINWYTQKITAANSYDNTNYNSIIYTVPTYLRDDQNNENYMTFLYMVGQHFDNLWLYSKAVTDKYDADNRIGHGISKDLVAEALKNFGVKLYTSNKSIEDLFTAFIGQSYQSGSEVINHYITGSLTGSNAPIQPVSYDDYNKEVQKRIYHNLSHLLKTKGTERGLRALINCFGISSDILKIKQYGGRNTNERPFFGDYQPYTSSLGKIRLDNTGSLISGSTLSSYTSIIKRENTYTDDLHAIEVGFSPVDNIDNYILSNITASFDIDDYIGDPGDLTSGSYSGLSRIANTLLSGSLGTDSHYDLQDYVRLIKFYDNTIFKMIKDFIPARVVADTGVIIKPNLLNRSKAKSVTVSGSRPELSGSIDTAFTEGNNAGIFDISTGESSTAYVDNIQTSNGIVTASFIHGQQQPKYNGELSGSNLTVTNGNLTADNPYLLTISNAYNFGTIQYVSSSTEVCLLATTNQIQYITSSTQQFQPSDFFNIGGDVSGIYQYSASNGIVTPIYTQVTPAFTFGNYAQYTDFYLVARNPAITSEDCARTATLRFGTCSISLNNTAPNFVSSTNPVNLTAWFNITTIQTASVQYTASWVDNLGVSQIAGIPSSQTGSYIFTQGEGKSVTIKVIDPYLGNLCQLSKTVNVGTLTIGTIVTGSSGLEFKYSYINNNSDGGTVDENNCYDESGNFVCSNTVYSFLGIPKITSAPVGGSPARDKRGIPGFFTDLPATSWPNNPTDLPGGSSIKYRVFEVVGDSNGTSIGPYYKVQLVQLQTQDLSIEGFQTVEFTDLSPYGAITSPRLWLKYDLVGSGGDFVGTNQQLIYYVTRFQDYQPYTNQQNINQVQSYLSDPNGPYGDLLDTGKWPLTLTTAYKDNAYSAGTPDFDTRDLVRAYIVQAYNPSLTGSVLQYDGVMRQVTVYGDKATLNPTTGYKLEGAGNVPHFIDEYLKVGWDYPNLGIPSEQNYGTNTNKQENPPNSITPGDIWVKFPRRYWT